MALDVLLFLTCPVICGYSGKPIEWDKVLIIEWDLSKQPDMKKMKPNTKSIRKNSLDVEDAVKSVLKGMSIQDAAEMYSLSKSAVGRAVKMARCQKLPDYKHIVNIGNRKIFHVSEESAIAEYLQTSSNMCYGLTKLQTRQLAYKYGIALNSNSILESWHQNKMAGKQWLESFLIRHPKLSLRKPEKVSLAHATAFNEHTVSMFFDNLLEVQLKYKFKPECIFNADETGLLTVTDPPKIISTRGTKRVSQAVSAERGSLVTMLAFVNAMGNTVPPVFIFPRVNYKDFMICGAPTGSLGLCNKSGWMTSENFLVAMKHFVSHAKPSVEHPVLLLMDNHESHISFETITFAKENSLILLTFPPHCSHRLQPLDVSVFGPFKSYFRLAQNEWLASNPGRIINIYILPQLACKAYNMSFTIKNVCSGFSKSGIYPLNRQIFGESDFISSSVSDRPLLVEQPEIKQPDNQQSYEINKQVDSSESSVKIVSPESIHPYPKAPPRKDS
ncbi:uncharacterized protein LOC136096322 [Hydra vulgaris]|uniref:uncharacterized protein LOC136096322 n=1 Tax=Hydra vulgaris TaxID=6087 RepID=UPI0032E9D96B